MDKAELVIQAMQQRIGELVSQYETHIAVLRAEITQLSNLLKSQEDQEEQQGE